MEYGTKLIHNDEGSHSDSFRINLESFGTFRSHLFHKPVTDRELFLEGRYAEAALEEKQANLKFYKSIIITTNLIHTTPSPCSWAKTTEVVSLALVPNRRSGSNKTSTILSEKPARKKRCRKKNHFSSMSN